MLNYLIKDCIEFKCGFPLTCHDVVKAIDDTNQHLAQLPSSLFRAIDYKTTSAMIGCILCDNISLNSKVFSQRSPSLLFIFFGKPRTIFSTLYSLINSSIRANV